jgi:hypothetical protein
MKKQIRTLGISLVERNVDEGAFAGSCRWPEKKRCCRNQLRVKKELALGVSSWTPWRRSSIYSDLGGGRCLQTSGEAGAVGASIVLRGLARVISS